jgi:hypothetical protein
MLSLDVVVERFRQALCGANLVLLLLCTGSVSNVKSSGKTAPNCMAAARRDYDGPNDKSRKR